VEKFGILVPIFELVNLRLLFPQHFLLFVSSEQFQIYFFLPSVRILQVTSMNHHRLDLLHICFQFPFFLKYISKDLLVPYLTMVVNMSESFLKLIHLCLV
jgi:hypothetical protein